MNKLKRISLITLCSIILFATVTFAKTGTVNAPSGLVLRKQASKTSDPITTVNDKAKVEILEESGEWYKVNKKNLRQSKKKNQKQIQKIILTRKKVNIHKSKKLNQI